jgi:hypothetical protein
MAITNPSKSCRAESEGGWTRCSHSEHDAETATGRPVAETRGSGLPIFDALVRDTFGS